MKEKKTTKKMSNRKFTIVWSSVLAAVLALTVIINCLAQYFNGYLDLFFGSGDIITTKTENSEDWDSEYYTLDYASSEDLQQAADDLVEEIEAEGIVLLKNNGALPLAGASSVTLLGRAAADPVYGGSGSGAVSLDTVVDLKMGLENAGFHVNETVYDILADYAASNARGVIAMDNPSKDTYYIGEMPVEKYTGSALSSFSQYGDAAVVVIGRPGGEGGDLTRDMEGWDDHYEEGQHQLELNYDEKQVIALAKEHFSTVIVIINCSSVMELGDLEADDGIDAILWIGSPGQTGFNAVGNILCGNVTPSGHTADIYPSDLTKDPTYVNFGDFQYSNINSSNSCGDGHFVQYEEGIYVGYRYYETAAAEGYIDYDEAVVYPFGYGLSYTDFSWEIVDTRLDDVDGSITVDVKVTNTGTQYSGKEVVQLYYTAPYYRGGIEKAQVVLGDFAKTALLAPGEAETVTLSIAVEDMASYDYRESRAYVLEQGDYVISLRTDSHNVKEGCEPITYTVEETIVYSGDDHRASDQSEVTNQFDDVSAMFTDTPTEGYAMNMSRADFAGTFPTTPTPADMVANDSVVETYQVYSAKEHADPDAEMPTTGADNGLSLIDLRGLKYDDESWDLLLDQLTKDEMVDLVLNGAYTTRPMESINKPATTDLDGPAGISSYMTELSCTAYPSEVVIASTWNVDLTRRMGEMVGNEALNSGVSGWYAPGMNIHRSQFGGRNFEYYSEDPLLTGKIAASVVSGAASKGVYCTLKHFALNEQERNRVNGAGVSSWANEQTIREIYLKPFEYVIKNANQTMKYISDEEGTVSEVAMRACTAVMSSFNRIGGVWTGGSSALLQTVLRGEWGFEGLVISDFNLYEFMYPNQGIANGTDLMLTYASMKSMEDTTSATAISSLRNACHNILYTVVNSNAMNNLTPGTIITYTRAPWETGLLIADSVVGAALLLGVVWMIIRIKKHKVKTAVPSSES